ncbi:NDR1/HIN1-like protein 13 [Musa acuminata AAA Group]|uniref:NDR1/HIN1-like protein 13 n=1 Tax=Musa acuminata AAA Group TaxID=214697 RepID=UPI0031D04CE8
MSLTCVRVFLPFPFPFRANSATTTFSFLFYPLCNSPSPLMVERVPPCTPPSPEPQPAPSALLDTVPVPADPNPGPDPDPNPSRRLGTYVVRVPKDQVYRVPPPENAKLAERYRNQNRSRRRGSPCLSRLRWILGVAFLVLLLIVAVTVIFFVVVRPGAPTFTVQRLFVKSPRSTTEAHPKPEYDLTMSVRNPSRGMGFSYEAGGRAVITHGTVEIAAGTTPVFVQGHGNTTSIRLVLRGSNALLPKENGRSMKGSKNAVDISLMAKLTVRPRVGGLEMWAKSMDVTCDVQVIGMVKQAQISSQHCNTKL